MDIAALITTFVKPKSWVSGFISSYKTLIQILYSKLLFYLMDMKLEKNVIGCLKSDK